LYAKNRKYQKERNGRNGRIVVKNTMSSVVAYPSTKNNP
jgi:hypothetical protein